MTIREGTYQEQHLGELDKFPGGPWTGEPDKATWVDDETDLDCMIVRNHFGALCGYVGVPPEHPLHGLDYDQAHEKADIMVHGGLTYSDACQENGKICHVPLPGRTHDVWWFGFDCAHAWDLNPQDKKYEEELPDWPSSMDDDKTYKNWEFVKQEVTDLAQQLKEAMSEDK